MSSLDRVLLVAALLLLGAVGYFLSAVYSYNPSSDIYYFRRDTRQLVIQASMFSIPIFINNASISDMRGLPINTLSPTGHIEFDCASLIERDVECKLPVATFQESQYFNRQQLHVFTTVGENYIYALASEDSSVYDNTCTDAYPDVCDPLQWTIRQSVCAIVFNTSFSSPTYVYNGRIFCSATVDGTRLFARSLSCDDIPADLKCKVVPYTWCVFVQQAVSCPLFSSFNTYGLQYTVVDRVTPELLLHSAGAALTLVSNVTSLFVNGTLLQPPDAGLANPWLVRPTNCRLLPLTTTLSLQIFAVLVTGMQSANASSEICSTGPAIPPIQPSTTTTATTSAQSFSWCVYKFVSLCDICAQYNGTILDPFSEFGCSASMEVLAATQPVVFSRSVAATDNIGGFYAGEFVAIILYTPSAQAFSIRTTQPSALSTDTIISTDDLVASSPAWVATPANCAALSLSKYDGSYISHFAVSIDPADTAYSCSSPNIPQTTSTTSTTTTATTTTLPGNDALVQWCAYVMPCRAACGPFQLETGLLQNSERCPYVPGGAYSPTVDEHTDPLYFPNTQTAGPVTMTFGSSSLSVGVLAFNGSMLTTMYTPNDVQEGNQFLLSGATCSSYMTRFGPVLVPVTVLVTATSVGDQRNCYDSVPVSAPMSSVCVYYYRASDTVQLFGPTAQPVLLYDFVRAPLNITRIEAPYIAYTVDGITISRYGQGVYFNWQEPGDSQQTFYYATTVHLLETYTPTFYIDFQTTLGNVTGDGTQTYSVLAMEVDQHTSCTEIGPEPYQYCVAFTRLPRTTSVSQYAYSPSDVCPNGEHVMSSLLYPFSYVFNVNTSRQSGVFYSTAVETHATSEGVTLVMRTQENIAIDSSSPSWEDSSTTVFSHSADIGGLTVSANTCTAMFHQAAFIMVFIATIPAWSTCTDALALPTASATDIQWTVYVMYDDNVADFCSLLTATTWKNSEFAINSDVYTLSTDNSTVKINVPDDVRVYATYSQTKIWFYSNGTSLSTIPINVNLAMMRFNVTLEWDVPAIPQTQDGSFLFPTSNCARFYVQQTGVSVFAVQSIGPVTEPSVTAKTCVFIYMLESAANTVALYYVHALPTALAFLTANLALQLSDQLPQTIYPQSCALFNSNAIKCVYPVTQTLGPAAIFFPNTTSPDIYTTRMLLSLPTNEDEPTVYNSLNAGIVIFQSPSNLLCDDPSGAAWQELLHWSGVTSASPLVGDLLAFIP